jgi:hypothetical protein
MVEPKRDTAPVMEVFESEPIAEQPTMGSNPEAPYGYKKDGTPAKRRGRVPGSTLSGTRRTGSRGSLRTQIGGMLQLVNMPIQIISPKNALDAVEIDALAKSLDEECQRSARFRKYMEQMLAVQGGTSLILVVGAIAGRRVVRNNLVAVPSEVGGNEGLDAIIGGFISMTTGSGPINPNLRVMTQQDG